MTGLKQDDEQPSLFKRFIESLQRRENLPAMGGVTLEHNHLRH